MLCLLTVNSLGSVLYRLTISMELAFLHSRLPLEAKSDTCNDYTWKKKEEDPSITKQPGVHLVVTMVTTNIPMPLGSAHLS